MALAAVKPITAVRKNDVEWIIKLWLAIHGGDPAPQLASKVSADIIKGLAKHLDPAHAKAVTAALSH